jgi:hypothetical protein
MMKVFVKDERILDHGVFSPPGAYGRGYHGFFKVSLEPAMSYPSYPVCGRPSQTALCLSQGWPPTGRAACGCPTTPSDNPRLALLLASVLTLKRRSIWRDFQLVSFVMEGLATPFLQTEINKQQATRAKAKRVWHGCRVWPYGVAWTP